MRAGQGVVAVRNRKEKEEVIEELAYITGVGQRSVSP